MTSQPEEPATADGGDQDQDQAGAGVEVGMTDGEGSTFEPEEDPEAHADRPD